MNSTKTLILDNQPIIRSAIACMLKDIATQTNIFQSNSIQDARRILREHSIDMIILDIRLKDGSGLDFIQRIRQGGFGGKILFFSSHENHVYSNTAKSIGANGYILKTEESSLIVDAILSIIRGYTVFKQRLFKENDIPKLSERESLVFSYLSKGYTNKKISEVLSLSSKTVSTYKSRILEKYNASSIIEIIDFQQA
ncbi:response regulator [Vibrio sp. TRT 1302]|uniref:response regulator n=1 Tax=Vibrio sp. TRT 1302 TaxID=3418504 RepID=UPI003CF3ACAB